MNTINGEVCTGISPGPAALKVEQPWGCHRIADAARQGVEPSILEVNRVTCEWTGFDCSTFAVACPIEHIAEPDHPAGAGELIIAANLTATGKARTVSRDFSSIESRTGVAECPADVGADVKQREPVEKSEPYQWRMIRPPNPQLPVFPKTSLLGFNS